MMEQSFTPGPWEVYAGGVNVACVNGEHVAHCETPEDARLISAAPDLLAALREVLQIIAYANATGQLPEGFSVHAAESAIAKAVA